MLRANETSDRPQKSLGGFILIDVKAAHNLVYTTTQHCSYWGAEVIFVVCPGQSSKRPSLHRQQQLVINWLETRGRRPPRKLRYADPKSWPHPVNITSENWCRIYENTCWDDVGASWLVRALGCVIHDQLQSGPGRDS